MSPSPSKEALITCPFCQEKGWTDDKIKSWLNTFQGRAHATMWHQCESCHAMWRQEYDFEHSRFRHAELFYQPA